jgi:uncharacterized membrane protein YjgN (DUF898 family)
MNEIASPVAPVPASPPPPAPEAVRFTGTGSEYFGIWIVNLLLTIVTIGIYSAWAKVRRLQYFYRHTEIAGSSFDFHGSPIKILIGRVIALLLFVAYNYSVRLRSPLTLFIILALALIMPWLLRNSFRFRLYNTSWRGTRFHFRGSVQSAYRVFLLNGFLSLITLYLFVPFAHQRLKAYQHDNTWFGRTRCSFHARPGQFYGIYALLLLAIVAFIVVIGASGVIGSFIAATQAQAQGGRIDPRLIFRSLAILYGAIIVLSISVGPAFQALITNLIWNNTRVGENRIACKLSPLMMIWIVVSNFVLVVLTLGLYIPWAAVRLTRYQLESVQFLPVGDLQAFEGDEAESIGAIGEETAAVFDFEISL